MIGFTLKAGEDINEPIYQCYDFDEPIPNTKYFRHLNYSVNPLSSSLYTWIEQYLQHTRSFKEQCLGFVVHLSSKKLPLETAFPHILKSLSLFLEDEMLLIENSWSPRDHGSSIEELATLMNMFEDKKHLGICLDTSHLYLAGYPLKTIQQVVKMLASFDELIGLKHLKLVHFNDVKGLYLDTHTMHLPIFQGNVFEIDSFIFLKDFFLAFEIPMILERKQVDLSELKLFLPDEDLFASCTDLSEDLKKKKLKEYFIRIGIPESFFKDDVMRCVSFTKQDYLDILDAQKALRYFSEMSSLCKSIGCDAEASSYHEAYQSLTLRRIPQYSNTLLGLDVDKIITCGLLSQEDKLSLITKKKSIEDLTPNFKRWFNPITLDDMLNCTQALKLNHLCEILGTYSRYLSHVYKENKAKKGRKLTHAHLVDNTIIIYCHDLSLEDYMKCFQMIPSSFKIHHTELIDSTLHVFTIRSNKCFVLRFILAKGLSHEQKLITSIFARGNSCTIPRFKDLICAKHAKLILNEIWLVNNDKALESSQASSSSINDSRRKVTFNDEAELLAFLEMASVKPFTDYVF